MPDRCKRYVFFLCLVTLLFCYHDIKCQEVPVSDSVLIESTFSGNEFIYRGEKLRPGKVLLLMENNEDAYDLMSKAQESYVFGNLFCIVGSRLLVYPIVSSFFDAQPHWVVAASGAGLILLSVPIFMNFNKQSTQAVILYNSSLGTLPKTSMINHSLEFGISSAGLGVRYRF